MNKLKQMRAITLIALIVTIVVIMMLAGTVINLSVGKNGIIEKAKTAVDKYKQAEYNEQIELSKITELVNGNRTISESDIEAVFKRLILDTYPVGSIYMSMSNVYPSNFIGGTWEQIGQGRTLIGEGTNGGYRFTAGSTGTTIGAEENPLGEYMHQLTVPEMPSHSHSFTGGGNTLVLHSNSSISSNQGFSNQSNGGWWYDANKNESSIASSGESNAHNIIQPYIVTYMWKRIS